MGMFSYIPCLYNIMGAVCSLACRAINNDVELGCIVSTGFAPL